jgi:DinB superfamily
MELKLDDAIAVLSRTPAALDALLRGMPEIWTVRNEGGETWSPFQIVGHLIHGDRDDWIARAKRILEFGECKSFEPFDRLAQERDRMSKTLDQLLDEFALVRREKIDELKALKLTPAELTKTGMHPALGVVTLSQLLATWAVHDLTHLHQVSRVMAHQYAHAVGPWTAYLGVLKCEGHSE